MFIKSPVTTAFLSSFNGEQDAGGTGKADPPEQDGTDTALPDEETDWKAKAREWETKARQNKADLNAANQELTTMRHSTLSDTDRQIAEARAEARAEALREVGGQIVRAHLTAGLTARGMSADDANAEVDDLDLARFLTDSGDVDMDKVNARLARARTATPGASTLGMGHTPAPKVAPGEAGAAEAARRYPIKK